LPLAVQSGYSFIQRLEAKVGSKDVFFSQPACCDS
jgi:hypothetical protein